jgi:hypothetical protein
MPNLVVVVVALGFFVSSNYFSYFDYWSDYCINWS